jgi:hypothetical protein
MNPLRLRRRLLAVAALALLLLQPARAELPPALVRLLADAGLPADALGLVVAPVAAASASWSTAGSSAADRLDDEVGDNPCGAGTTGAGLARPHAAAGGRRDPRRRAARRPGAAGPAPMPTWPGRRCRRCCSAPRHRGWSRCAARWCWTAATSTRRGPTSACRPSTRARVRLQRHPRRAVGQRQPAARGAVRRRARPAGGAADAAGRRCAWPTRWCWSTATAAPGTTAGSRREPCARQPAKVTPARRSPARGGAARHLAFALRPRDRTQRDRAQRLHRPPGARAVDRPGRALARQRARGHQAPPEATLLAERQSRPLSELVRAINKPSDNALTRLLLLALGAASPGEASEPTLLRAERAVRGWMRQQGHRRHRPGAGQRLGPVAQRTHRVRRSSRAWCAPG